MSREAEEYELREQYIYTTKEIYRTELLLEALKTHKNELLKQLNKRCKPEKE